MTTANLTACLDTSRPDYYPAHEKGGIIAVRLFPWENPRRELTVPRGYGKSTKHAYVGYYRDNDHNIIGVYRA